MKSEQINELAAALAKAQGQMTAANKDSTNPHFKSLYADLASIWDAIRGPLSTNGLAVVQIPSAGEGYVHIDTTLMHSSGQFIDGRLSMASGTTPQQIGSAITYARRYALSAITGIAPDDDDGNAAQDAKPAVRKAPAQPSQGAKTEALPPCETWDDLYPKWADLVMSGKKSAEKVCAQVRGKFTLTPEQDAALTDLANAIVDVTL